MAELPETYRACRHPGCLRKVAGSALYCCGGCAAANGPAPYDPEGYHTQQCELRAVERGEWTPQTRPAAG